MDRQRELADQLRYLLAAGKVTAALELLNTVSTCRFTALYRFEDGGLQNLVLVDRDTRDAPLLDTIPIEQSYCTYVQSAHASFVVGDSLRDERVLGHPKQRVIRSYVGVPLKASGGDVFGTLCHFDFDVADVPADAIALTEQVARFMDPDAAIEVSMEQAQRSLDALAGMLPLLFTTSAEPTLADAAFDEYAQPIRDAAAGRLPPDRHGLVEARIAALRASLLGMWLGRDADDNENGAT